jgi:hypothetical protein
VTTTVTEAAVRATVTEGSAATREDGLEAELRHAVESEQRRLAVWNAANGTAIPEAPEPESADPPEPLIVSRPTLPGGPALVCRDGIVWAARLLPANPNAEGVVVTIVGRGVAPESVRLRPEAGLRPMIEARAEKIRALVERGRRQPRPPLPELEPAEGIAALLALAEFTLASNEGPRESLRGADRPRRGPDWGGKYNALWQRAIREHQRLRGTDAGTAEDVVTSAVNHLGFLQEQAPWFTADLRLRQAAIDQALRHALLGDGVPSRPAQDAWTRYWSTRMTGPPHDAEPAGMRAVMLDRKKRSADCLLTWTAWAETA